MGFKAMGIKGTQQPKLRGSSDASLPATPQLVSATSGSGWTVTEVAAQLPHTPVSCAAQAS